MQAQIIRPVSGHIFKRAGKRGAVWYAKYRLPDGRQAQKRLGPAHAGNGRPPAGYYTKRTAEAALEALKTDARRGVLPEAAGRTGATFRDAFNEWLRYSEQERQVKRSTLAEYRSAVEAHLIPAFGDLALEDVTTQRIERWKSQMIADGRVSVRTLRKLLTNLHGIMERARRVWHLRENPVADVERPRDRNDPDAYDFYSPEEVWALVRATRSRVEGRTFQSENEEAAARLLADQDATLFLTAAFTGLRMGELLGLRWRDVDFDGEQIHVRRSIRNGVLDVPKGGRVRAVPMVPEVAEALAALPEHGGEEHLVFPSILWWERRFADDWRTETAVVNEFQDRSALRRRFVDARDRAGLRPIRFHDLRHTFGSLAIRRADPVEVGAWMGHADLKTTQRYLHHKSRGGEARRLAGAFAPEPVDPLEDALRAGDAAGAAR
jgi:integrase